MKKTQTAFTLVELIVVITILAVLATIGFVSMTGYSQSARDSTRLANLKVVEKALVFHHTQNSIFPEPSDVQTVTFNNGGTINLWKTGNVGQSVIQEVKSLNEIPLDPSTNLPIEYSTTLNWQKYQLKSYLENSVTHRFTNTVHANTQYPKIYWNYNKYFVIGSDGKYYSAPSLFASGSDVTNLTPFDITSKTVDYQVSIIQNSLSQDITTANVADNYRDFGLALQNAYTTSDLTEEYNILSSLSNDDEYTEFAQVITGNKAAGSSPLFAWGGWSNPGVWCVFDSSTFDNCNFQ